MSWKVKFLFGVGKGGGLGLPFLNFLDPSLFMYYHPYQKRLAHQPKLCKFDNEKNKYQNNLVWSLKST